MGFIEGLYVFCGIVALVMGISFLSNPKSYIYMLKQRNAAFGIKSEVTPQTRTAGKVIGALFIGAAMVFFLSAFKII